MRSMTQTTGPSGCWTAQLFGIPEASDDHTLLAVVSKQALDGVPADFIAYSTKRAARWDSGFQIFTAEDSNPLDMAGFRVVCLNCVIETLPSYVGAGLDLAKRAGEAWWAGEQQEWQATEPGTVRS